MEETHTLPVRTLSRGTASYIKRSYYDIGSIASGVTTVSTRYTKHPIVHPSTTNKSHLKYLK